MALVRDANGNLVDDGRPATGLAAVAYDPNPAVRNAQAGADARQQAAATGGRAAAMQAQANQPVYGPRNPPMQATPGYSSTPAVRAAQASNDARAQAAATGAAVVQPGYSTFTPVRDLQVAADERAQRSAVAAASGVQPAIAPAPAQPPALTVGPQGRPAALRGLAAAAGSSFFADATRYAADAAQRVGPIAYAVPGAAGLLPALSLARSDANEQQPAATPAQPAQPAMDPQIAAAFAARDSRRAADAAELTANADVLAQDRANLSAAVGPQFVGPEPDRDAPRPSTAPAPIAGERGNYNLANTSNVDSQGRITTRLRQPDNIIEGGYGQFGGGRAAQFLASRRNTGGSGGMSTASEEVRLRNQLVSDNPFERQAAREQMAARQALQLDAGATERQGMQLEGEQVRASLAGEAAVQAAQTKAAGDERAANIAGRYDVKAAETTALGRVIEEQAKEGSAASGLARINAEREALKVDQALEALAAQDQQAAQQWLGVSQGPVGRVVTDELGKPIGVATPDGVRGLTPQELAELQAAAAQQSVRPPQ